MFLAGKEDIKRLILRAEVLSLRLMIRALEVPHRHVAWSTIFSLPKIDSTALLVARHTYAVSTHAPPAALIFFSASLVKYRAFTITGIAGSSPLPSTLKNPAFPTSMTGALSFFVL